MQVRDFVKQRLQRIDYISERLQQAENAPAESERTLRNRSENQVVRVSRVRDRKRRVEMLAALGRQGWRAFDPYREVDPAAR